VNIRFSRHAKRRAKLYKIPESTIRAILSSLDPQRGRHVIMQSVKGYLYPLKIVITVESDVIKVITNYPLKKKKRRQA